jgi:hypothetical protein
MKAKGDGQASTSAHKEGEHSAKVPGLYAGLYTVSRTQLGRFHKMWQASIDYYTTEEAPWQDSKGPNRGISENFNVGFKKGLAPFPDGKGARRDAIAR